MSTQVQIRRGNTAQTAAFTGSIAELTVDTDKKVVVVHDGTTAGGIPLSKESTASTIFNHANGAFDKANSANVLAQAGYNQANTATTTAGLAYNHANGAFDKANTATTTADAAFTKANSANVIAQSAFDNSNTKFNSSGGSITGTVSVTGNVYAGNVIANSAFTSLAGLSKLQLSDIGVVAISVAGETFGFGGDGIESNKGVYGGSFGGNKLSLNNETNLISNRYDTVKIQTGTTGTAVNDFVFSNTSLTVPGGITANGFTAGGINVVPTLASSFNTANAAFTRANNSLNANTGGSITGDVTVTGNLTIVGQTIYANTTTALIADNIVTLNAAINQASAPTVNAGIEVDRGSSTNTSLLWNETSDKWTFTNDGSTYYDIADAGRLDSVFSLANGTAGVANTDYTTISASTGVYGNASHVTVTTLTANGRVSSITNTAIAIDTSAITSGTLTDARLPVTGTAGTYANATYVPVITTDAYGRVTAITNTAISFPSDTDTLQTVTTRGSTTANAINVTNTTSSTSKTTGALKVAGGVGVAGDLFAGNSIVVDGGAYGNVTISQFASVWGQAYGTNPYSIMQVRSSDFATGMGMQVYTGLNGLLYSNTGIQFTTGTNVRDKDYATGGTNAGQFAANGAFIAQASLASTSNATGSIQVVGGVGVKGNVAADGIIFPDNTRQTTAATAGASIGDVLALSIALG